MTSPFLAYATTTLDGRGYKDIFDTGKKLPSITTILKSMAMPGISQWAVNNTVAYCAVNAEELASREPDMAYAYGRWYWKREPEFDSPDYDPFNYHAGVLQDAADQGNFIHAYIEARLLGLFEPDPQNEAHEQMINAFELWFADNDVEPELIEATVYGDGYAGTFDGLGKINGVRTLWDNKSSVGIRDSHVAQLGAIGAAHTVAIEAGDGVDGAVEHTRDGVTKYFVPEALPGFEQYGVLQVRPDSVNHKGEFIPSFCRFEVIPHEAVEAGYVMFRGALDIKTAGAVVSKALRELEKGE